MTDDLSKVKIQFYACLSRNPTHDKKWETDNGSGNLKWTLVCRGCNGFENAAMVRLGGYPAVMFPHPLSDFLCTCTFQDSTIVLLFNICRTIWS